MVRIVLARAGLLLSLLLLLAGLTPALAAAQTSTPEGTDWHLATYADGDRVVSVPWQLQATLHMEDGLATGSTGCNGFSGSYALDGNELSFGPLGVTQMACPGEAMTLENGYLAALPQVVSWAIDTGPSPGESGLYLYDADGEIILTFQPPILSLTRHDIDALATQLAQQQAAIERLGERVDNVRVGTLRERIRSLESTVKKLRARGTAASPTFSTAETVLLEGIPGGIRNTCLPRRSDNPAGTVAAVQCQPATSRVRDMAYYLMESDDAWDTWRQRMRENGAWNKNGECRKGRIGTSVATGGLEASGCYRNDDGRANLRYATSITACRQLKAGDTRLEKPAVYIAVLGPDGDIAKLTKWAESRPYGGPEDLVQTIKRPKEAWSDICPR